MEVEMFYLLIFKYQLLENSQSTQAAKNGEKHFTKPIH